MVIFFVFFPLSRWNFYAWLNCERGLIIFQVHGGSSGIGIFAIQIAKHIGARVFVTAGLPSLIYLISWHQFLVFTCFRPFFPPGNEEKLAVCKDLGADVCINYKTEDFVARVKEETGGKGTFYGILTIISIEDGIGFFAPNPLLWNV